MGLCMLSPKGHFSRQGRCVAPSHLESAVFCNRKVFTGSIGVSAYLHGQNTNLCEIMRRGASRLYSNGISRIDTDMCLGGSKCKAGNGIMNKCDRCHNRTAQDEVASCIEACPEEVQIIGPRPEIVAQAHARASEIGGYIYGGHENGGTNTLYVSTVLFETLNAAIEKGPGRPHPGPAADRMADASNLGAALLIAALAVMVFLLVGSWGVATKKRWTIKA